MKNIKSCSLLETDKKNKYFYDSRMKRTQLCHPLLFHMLKLSSGGKDIESWMENLGEFPIEIDGVGRFSKKEFKYYYQKYLILKENGHFTLSTQEEKLAGVAEPETIERNLANSKQVVFEVTDNCNLNCHYCGYGKFYSDYDLRANKKLDTRSAKQLLDFLVTLWNSPSNNSLDSTIFIGFYGGEPLLNFPFIKAIVEYIEHLDAHRNRFAFSMTTNGLLLEKYMDFLVEKKFKLLLSLDGNEKNTAYRRFKNGKPAYKTILANVKALQKKHPDYFLRNVNFNAVLHNKNSVSDIYHYFKKNFGKTPSIGELNTTGIQESHKKEFRETYTNVYESLHQSEDYRPIEEDMFIKLPEASAVVKYLNFGSDFCFTDYNGLLYSCNDAERTPTGTCSPFSKKIYVTVNGKILPCERIGQQFGLGTVTPEGVELDCVKIAKKYNAYFDKLRKQCHACHNASTCIQCLFNLDTIDKKKTVCHGFMAEEKLARNLAANISYLEKHPKAYSKILREVTVD